MGKQSPSRWRQTLGKAQGRSLAAASRLRPYFFNRLSFLALAAAVILSTCSPKLGPWEQIQRDGVLRLITYNNSTTYYIGPEGPTGFEYDLANQFAQSRGLELEVVTADTPQEMIDRLLNNEAHIAAGLTITPKRLRDIQFSQPIHEIQGQLVYRAGESRPRNVESAITPSENRKLEVLPGSSHAEQLSEITDEKSDPAWEENPYANSEELLHRVATGHIDYTIAYSHLVIITARYYPQLRVAFDIGAPEQLAWAFAPASVDKLLPRANDFITQLRKSGELTRTVDRYFSSADNLGYVGASKFAEHVKLRLPLYEEAFKEAADKHGLDWRLLAAVGYQESHWLRHARSPTGVRGLMMLTEATAKEMGIPDRTDPFQSIKGGAQYLREQIDRQPPEIVEPDRTWMGLATYNIGHGHMIDVRELTRQLGANPYYWIDVRKHLPLLMQPRWYKRTKYGYARGREAMQYVANIRSYYDILRWMTSTEEMLPPEGVDPELIPRPEPAERALEIDSPIL
ncbi:MAG: membrane-bound lytic murein transglycosylase MltF [Nevskiales bacterium]